MKVSEEILSLVPYKPGKPIGETQREFGLKEVVKLASNENPLGPSPKVIQALQRAIGEIHRYPDGAAYDLRRACSRFFGIDEKCIAIGNGSNELIDLLIRLYCLPGDRIVTTRSAFIAYKICAQIARVETVEIPLTHELVFDIDRLEKWIDAKWTESCKLIFIPNPNNPTGTYVGKNKMDAFLEKFGRRQDMMIVFDEAYSEYVRASDCPDALEYMKKYENVVVLRTLSKAYGLAGLRIGLLFARPDVVDLVQRIRMPFNVNSLAQAGAIAALQDIEYVEKSKKINAEGLDYFYREFDALGVSYVRSQGNFVLFDPGKDADGVALAMLKEGVIVRPLPGYGLGNRLRISIGLPAENHRAMEVLKKVLAKT